MSTLQTLSAVKQALLEKVHQEIVPQLERFVLELPDDLFDFHQAEVHLRQRMLTYLENNHEHMDYPRYRALGLPIGSGQVEAQCKTLVGARCNKRGCGTERMREWRAFCDYVPQSTFDEIWDRRLELPRAA